MLATEANNGFKLDGKVALVTGSTRGIGRAIAEGFAQAGARVWVHGRDEESGQHLAKHLDGRFVAADLSSVDDIRSLVKTIESHEGCLDVLVNNAGLDIVMPLESMDMAVFDTLWQVNVRAPVDLVRQLLPMLRAAPEASVINVTSIHDTAPYAFNSAYCAMKAALAMFSKTIAVELAPHGIRVNNLAPGAVETDINRRILEDIGRDKFAEWIPMGRVAQTKEMVGPALFLASSAASYVTGSTLYADGAYMQHLVRYRYDG